MEKIEKPKRMVLSSKSIVNYDVEILENIIELIINDNYETARNQIELISINNGDPVLYIAVKARLAFEEDDADNYMNYFWRLIYGGHYVKGLPEYMVDLVNNNNSPRLCQLSFLWYEYILANHIQTAKLKSIVVTT